MKQFLAIYLGSAAGAEKSGWNALDDATRKKKVTEGMKAWGDWTAAHQSNVIVHGSPLGKTKRTAADGVSDTKNAMTGYVIVQAESHEAAAKMFENHPHFSIFPGESVEIMECLPLPQRS